MKSRRLIACPRGSEEGIVAGQSGRLEVVRSGSPMSALGQKQTLAPVRVMSALPPKADIDRPGHNVRFVPEADILRCGSEWRYSITSSARRSNDGGIERPSVFAVLRLTVSANLVGACAGKSAGFAPLRILSTYSAAPRNWSFQSRLYDSSPPAVTASLSA